MHSLLSLLFIIDFSFPLSSFCVLSFCLLLLLLRLFLLLLFLLLLFLLLLLGGGGGWGMGVGDYESSCKINTATENLPYLIFNTPSKFI